MVKCFTLTHRGCPAVIFRLDVQLLKLQTLFPKHFLKIESEIEEMSSSNINEKNNNRGNLTL